MIHLIDTTKILFVAQENLIELSRVIEWPRTVEFHRFRIQLIKSIITESKCLEPAKKREEGVIEGEMNSEMLSNLKNQKREEEEGKVLSPERAGIMDQRQHIIHLNHNTTQHRLSSSTLD